MKRGYKIKSFEHRFWKKVNRLGPDECWLWTAAVNTRGYGQIGVYGTGKVVMSHRASWELTFGQIPTGLFVCHRCDVRSCCNPRHLFLGTAKDNYDDMVKKGRRRFCALRHGDHPFAKLSTVAVQEIREQYAAVMVDRARTPHKFLKGFADRYGVKASTIHSVCRGVSWR